MQTNSTNNDLPLGSEPWLSGSPSLGFFRWGKQIRNQNSSSRPRFVLLWGLHMGFLVFLASASPLEKWQSYEALSSSTGFHICVCCSEISFWNGVMQANLKYKINESQTFWWRHRRRLGYHPFYSGGSSHSLCGFLGSSEHGWIDELSDPSGSNILWSHKNAINAKSPLWL